ncbi:UNVERIFIED_ORG: 16S rRNA (uracil1498-N3)-methyltransferase [Zoogloea ramigera]|uniref:Ribosomal RNA small subunit methyltransferase E n=1 Tax=Duganella zoogloeoides TaxID=75659 RepID=A0ABZ0XWA3_9BURK|nr:16S rRNA (uracil(1498)-N(3))-methyltransferase [Duganella zoogloeoides]WQH03506.1 16S rRNA (uracil(1498)-N(3))-methyltransferase [Duganella zoogloeoides]
MPRFYLPLPLAVGQRVTLPDTLAHHIQVLRLTEGDTIALFNGAGGQYTATLREVARRSASVDIDAHLTVETELPFAVTLAQALPEASKMDWIIEKAMELGVSAIEPLATQRCVVRLSAERAEKKLAHWQGIIASAAEQCGRNRLATLAPPQDYKQWIARAPEAAQPRIILSPRATLSLAGWARAQPPQTVTLVIGPEGGLSEAEEELALRHGGVALSMGPRILRTETAGLSALAILSACWGGM